MSRAIVPVVPADVEHRNDWLQMRLALWPDGCLTEYGAEIADILNEDTAMAAFMALDAHGAAIGFAEATLRQDYVNGCDTTPVLFIEGVYVCPDFRRTGIAKRLIEKASSWGRTQGCMEMASDALIDNLDSHAFHKAAGFAETERVVYFRKLIG